MIRRLIFAVFVLSGCLVRIQSQSPCGCLIAGNNGGRFYKIDLSEESEELVIDTGSQAHRSLAVDLDTDTYYSISWSGRQLRVVDLCVGILQSIASDASRVRSLTYDQENDVLYGSDDSGTIFRMDPSTGDIEEVATGVGDGFTAMAYVEGGTLYGMGQTGLESISTQGENLQTVILTTEDFRAMDTLKCGNTGLQFVAYSATRGSIVLIDPLSGSISAVMALSDNSPESLVSLDRSCRAVCEPPSLSPSAVTGSPSVSPSADPSASPSMPSDSPTRKPTASPVPGACRVNSDRQLRIQDPEKRARCARNVRISRERRAVNVVTSCGRFSSVVGEAGFTEMDDGTGVTLDITLPEIDGTQFSILEISVEFKDKYTSVTLTREVEMTRYEELFLYESLNFVPKRASLEITACQMQ